MKKILVPTDFSDNANNALEYALELAKKNDAKVSLLNVYHIPAYDPNMPPDVLSTEYIEYAEISKDSLKANMEKIIKKNSSFDNFIEGVLSRMGVLSDEISTTAEEGKFDLIVMGTKGASGLEEAFIGSNASSLVNKAPVPVICIPDQNKYKDPQCAVMPIELDDSEFETIRSAKKLLPRYCKLHVIYIVAVGKSLSKTEQKLYLDLKAEFEPECSFEIVVSDDIAFEVDLYIQDNNCDMLIVSTVKRNIFEKLFHKSVTKKLVCHTHIPLLALHKASEHK